MISETKKYIEIPDSLPVLPVRNTVVFPNAAIPLIVGRQRSISAIKAAKAEKNLILVVAQKDGNLENPTTDQLYEIGTVCLITKLTKLEKGGYQLLANGLFRFRVSKFHNDKKILTAEGTQLSEVSLAFSARAETLASEIKALGKSILKLSAIPGADALIRLFKQIDEPGHIADLCSTFLQVSVPTKQQLLENQDIENRLEQLLELMVREKEKLQLQSEIQAKMMERLSKDQRQHLLREQVKTIKEELGDETDVTDELAKKIEEVGLSEEAKKIAKDELARLLVVQRASPEYHVIRTYLEWLLALPWKSEERTEEIDLKKAREVLDEDHFGIEKVKKRILQFLAVGKLKRDLRGPILCLLGPPGVGKTSLGKSIAKALNREFVRTSLGGVRDEAEIRGHRRTYIGALPGRVIQRLKRVGVKDPVFLLDEIDKIGADFRGDPASALLEVLDPEQNTAFVDHYLDVAFDLSKIFFLTTANRIDTIPPALRDRLEIIDMTSYSKAEKLQIAKRHLVSNALADHGIKKEQLIIPDTTVESIIDGYTREAGVRTLQRRLASLCRSAAEALAEKTKNTVTIEPQHLEKILGPRKFFDEKAEDIKRPGVATGLAWTPVGGDILKVEVAKMEGKGNLILTGQMGDVMKESAQLALSLIRANWGHALPIDFDKTDFHIHVPAGAIPKDGPSAGVAIFLALNSLLEGKPLNSKLAVTGEITLRGTILPVGGIKEKVLAAHRAGISQISLPQENAGDLVDVSEDVREQLTFHFSKDVGELTRVADLPTTSRLADSNLGSLPALPN